MAISIQNHESWGLYLLRRLRNARAKLYTFLVRSYFRRLESHLHPDTEIINPQYVSIGRNVVIRPGVWLYAITGDPSSPDRFQPSLEIENGCSIGRFCHITCSNRVVLGEEVFLTEGILITDSSHGYEDPNTPVIAQSVVSSGPVVIGCGTWIGNGARILGRVSIGRNCVIGANCVVTNMDIPDHSVVVGIPARIVRRYDQALKLWRRTDAHGNFTDAGQPTERRECIDRP
jgi:acetyltransferase-like isoleucine patch superfamily enzyme